MQAKKAELHELTVRLHEPTMQNTNGTGSTSIFRWLRRTFNMAQLPTSDRIIQSELDDRAI